MATASQKYDAKVNDIQKRRNSVINRQDKMLYKNGRHLKYSELSTKQKRAYDALDKKKQSDANQLNKLNSSISKNQKSKSQHDYAQATKNNINNDSNHNKFAYLRVNNPNSNHSYVYLFVSSESPTASNNISNEANEHGINRMTNTQMQPLSINIEGTIFNESDGLRPVKKVVNKIISWTNNGTEMCYSGVQFYRRCVITSFNPTFNNGNDGSTNSCSFSMSIQAAMYFDDSVKKSYKTIKRTGNKGAKKGTTQGKNYVVAKKGDSLARIAKSKNVKLSTIKQLNGDSIKSGQKIYY